MNGKRWIGAAIWMLFAFCGYGQNVGGGGHVGLGFSQVDGDGFGGYSKVGIHLGGFAYYDFAEKWAFQPEILFSQRGARNAGVVPLFHLRMNYVDVPLLFKYHIVGTDEHGLKGHLGPSLGFLINAVSGQRGFTNSATSDFSRVDYGFHLGFDYNFHPNMGINLRHSMGFLFLTSSRQAGTNWPWRHRYISLGFRFWGK